MDIRVALMNKLHNCNHQELKSILDQGISSKEESILPGLGVLFEKYYLSIDDQDSFINSLVQLLK